MSIWEGEGGWSCRNSATLGRVPAHFLLCHVYVCDEMRQWRLHTPECLSIKGKPKTTLVTIWMANCAGIQLVFEVCIEKYKLSFCHWLEICALGSVFFSFFFLLFLFFFFLFFSFLFFGYLSLKSKPQSLMLVELIFLLICASVTDKKPLNLIFTD